MIKLSIIIPCYNAKPYIDELIARLASQITDEVEVIIVDDGSREAVKIADKRFKVIRKENGGVSSARNVGLSASKGEYIAFIDADDLVSIDYVKTILEAIRKEQFDYCYLSWEAFGGGWNYKVILDSVKDNFPPFNRCVWNRIYKRSMIGKVRFNENKPIAEDAEFIAKVKEKGKKKAFINHPIYYYRTGHGGNLTERFTEGAIDFDRVVYNLPKVGKDDVALIQEIKRANKKGEVIVMTNNCEADIEDYALVIPPQRISGTELRGVPTSLFRKIEKPIKSQVVVYVGNTQEVGGIETFLYNFADKMCKLYDILIIYGEHMAASQVLRLSQKVMVIRNNGRAISCDTLINIRITDEVPANIHYRKKIQMIHICQMAKSGKYHYEIVKGWDKLVAVSDVAGQSYKDQAEAYDVIPNLTTEEAPKRPLILLSATRLTYEKGEARMMALAKELIRNNIPFLWLVFSPVPLREQIPFVVQCPTTLDIRSYMTKADYVVQLSDKEAFCYTIREALELGVPVLTTPIDVLAEIGFVDGQNGYVLPFDMADIDVRKIYNNVPSFSPIGSNNEDIVDKWRTLLGNAKPKGTYKAPKGMAKITITENYIDRELGREVIKGEILEMRMDRALMLINRGYAEKS